MEYDVGKQFEIMQAKLDFLVECEQERQKKKEKVIEKPVVEKPEETVSEDEEEEEEEEEEVVPAVDIEEPIHTIKPRAKGPKLSGSPPLHPGLNRTLADQDCWPRRKELCRARYKLPDRFHLRRLQLPSEPKVRSFHASRRCCRRRRQVAERCECRRR